MKRAVDPCGLRGSLLKTTDENTRAIKGEESSGGKEGNYRKDDTPIRKAREGLKFGHDLNLNGQTCARSAEGKPKNVTDFKLCSRFDHSSWKSFIIYSTGQKSEELSILFWPEK